MSSDGERCCEQCGLTTFPTADAAAGSVEFGMLTMRVADVFVFVRNVAQLGEFILYVIAAIVADVIK